MNKKERELQDRREYAKEETQKLHSKLLSRVGRPGERDPYPDLGKEYWERSKALGEFESETYGGKK